MTDSNLRPPPASSARPIASSHSRRTSDVSYSQSPSRASATARLATPIQSSPQGTPSARPSRPQTIEQQGTAPLAGAGGSSVPGPGTSSLSQALRRQSGQSPARSGPQGRNDGPQRYDSPERQPGGGTYGSPGSHIGKGNEDIEVLKRHLVGSGQAGSPSGSYRQQESASKPSVADQDPEFSSLQLQGGDTTRHIYRYAEKKEREQAETEGRGTGKLRRSLSVNLPKQDLDDDARSIQVPGGFRREHIRRTAGSPAPSSTHRRTNYGTTTRSQLEPPRAAPHFATSNFIEFLTLYGHFAGEELDEDDEALGPDEYFSSDAYDDETTEAGDNRSDDGWGEDSALLTPGKRKWKRRHREAGKGTPMGAAMLLLKSFVGTGVLFLPRAFYNGGMGFSFLILLVLAGLSYYCFILLVRCRSLVPVSYGDMGLKIYGPTFRNMINFSLVISQIGFASAYIVFVSENLQAFILAVSHCRTSWNVYWFIIIQAVIFLPISLYRNINNIQKLALIADLFIVLGLLYIYYYDIKTIVERPGIGDISNFNAASWPLLIGTAIFTFEGVGLVIPIQSGMREPEKFPKVLASVMVIISVVFMSAGALSYAAYGSNTKTVILLNMPQDDKLVNGVQFLYSVAILLSTPLQIYPAIEITSQQLFSKTGKYNPYVKWKKNVFRFFMVLLCAAVAWAGADDLDKFVSLVGSFACIPLVYIYPPLMHYRIDARRFWQKAFNVFLVVFGFCMMAYTTALTIISWIHGRADKTPGYCDEL